MRVGLIDVDSHNFPNLCLMKLSEYHTSTLEIVSNNASEKVQEVNLQGRKVILRKAKIPVTRENYKILQFLDFFKDVELYMDKNNEVYIDRIKRYIVDEQICKMDVDFYIRQYPDRIYRSIHEMGLYEFFV